MCSYMQSVEGVLGTNNYQHNKVNQWTSAVVEQCLNQLTKLAKPFKYIGTYIITILLHWYVMVNTSSIAISLYGDKFCWTEVLQIL